MSIARNTLTYWIAQFGNLIMALLTSIVVSRCLGPELRGIFIAAILANTMLVNMTQSGLASIGRFFAAGEPDNLARLHTLIVRLVCIIVALDAALLAIFGHALERLVLGKADVPGVYLAATLLVAPAVFYQLAGQAILIGLGHVRALSRLLFYSIQVQNVLTILGLTYFNWAVRGVVAVWVVGQIVSAAALYVLLRRCGPLWTRLAPGEARRELRRMISYGLRDSYGSFAQVVLSRFDQVFILSVLGAVGIGVYSISSRLAEFIFQPAQALENSGYASVRRAAADEAGYLVRELFRATFLINAGLVALLVVFARPIIIHAYTAEFAGAARPLQILLPGTLVLACGRMLAMYFSAHLGRPQVTSTVQWLAALVYIPAMWEVVVRRGWGMTGAAFVTTGSYFIFFFGLWILFARRTGLWNPIPYLVPQRRDFQRLRRALGGRLGGR